MSKGDKLREQQTEINSLKSQLFNCRKQLEEYRKRDVPQLGDFVRRKKHED